MKIESFFLVFATFFIDYVVGKTVVPVLTLDPNQRILAANKTVRNRKVCPPTLASVILVGTLWAEIVCASSVLNTKSCHSQFAVLAALLLGSLATL